MAEQLDTDTIMKALDKLDGWGFDAGKIERDFKFKDFREAVGFLVRVAFEAESMNHHPQIENVYNNVTLRLTTHDAGNNVTQKDLDLAERINAIAG